MSPETAFFVLLALKMAASAAVVVAASVVAERAGALIGAMVATLPIASGPAYVLLAIDHDTQFIADSTVTSLAVHAATGVMGLVYVWTAQRLPYLAAVGLAAGAWFGCAFLIRATEWSIAGSAVLCVVTYAVCVPLVRPFLNIRVPAIRRRWFDIPLRAVLVAALAGTVVTVAAHVGPKHTGDLEVFPIVILSLMAILHPRVGGAATAAVIANAMLGLIGFGFTVLWLHFAVVPLGAGLGLLTALLVSMVFNTAVFLARWRIKASPPANPARPRA